MPKGVMTNYGEFLFADDSRVFSVCILCKDNVIDYFLPSAIAIELAPADKQPWLLHMGGVCPVPEDMQVEVRFRCGNKYIGTAWAFGWIHAVMDYDIIAYRVVGESE